MTHDLTLDPSPRSPPMHLTDRSPFPRQPHTHLGDRSLSLSRPPRSRSRSLERARSRSRSAGRSASGSRVDALAPPPPRSYLALSSSNFSRIAFQPRNCLPVRWSCGTHAHTRPRTERCTRARHGPGGPAAWASRSRLGGMCSAMCGGMCAAGDTAADSRQQRWWERGAGDMRTELTCQAV